VACYHHVRKDDDEKTRHTMRIEGIEG